MNVNNRQRHSVDSNRNTGQTPSSQPQRYTNRSYGKRESGPNRNYTNPSNYGQRGGFNKNITSCRPEQNEPIKNLAPQRQSINNNENVVKTGQNNPSTPQKKKQTSKKTSKKKRVKSKKPKTKIKLSKANAKQVLKNTNRKIAAIACSVVLVAGLGTWALVGRDRSRTMVCESTVDYNKGIGYTFYLGRNGKTIDTIEKNDTVSLKFIEKNLGEGNAQQILDEYKKKTTDTYNQTVEKYKKYSFFSSEIKETDSKIVVNYRIRVADENFSYQKYKDVLEDFGMAYFYDSDTDSFTYNEENFLSKDIPLGSIEDVGCRESKKKLKIKKATKDSSSSNKTTESEDGGSNG